MILGQRLLPGQRELVGEELIGLRQVTPSQDLGGGRDEERDEDDGNGHHGDHFNQGESLRPGCHDEPAMNRGKGISLHRRTTKKS